MVYLIIMFILIEILTAYYFYLIGWNEAVKTLEDAGAMCDEWYNLKYIEENENRRNDE